MKPVAFIWCGTLYDPLRSNPILSTPEFYHCLGAKMLAVSGRNTDEGYTIDAVTEGGPLIVYHRKDEAVSLRQTYCPLVRLESDDAFLKPREDCVGKTFMQLVAGSKKFLKAAARELYSEDGWPSSLAGDAESYINDLTLGQCTVGFVWPKRAEPLIVSVPELEEALLVQAGGRSN